MSFLLMAFVFVPPPPSPLTRSCLSTVACETVIFGEFLKKILGPLFWWSPITVHIIFR